MHGWFLDSNWTLYIVLHHWCTLGYFTRELDVLSLNDASIDVVTVKPNKSSVPVQNSMFDSPFLS